MTLVKPLIDEGAPWTLLEPGRAWQWSRGLHLVARRRRMPPNSEVKESTSPGWVREQVPGTPLGQVAEKVCPYGGCASTGRQQQYRATGGPARGPTPASHVVTEMEQARRPSSHKCQGSSEPLTAIAAAGRARQARRVVVTGNAMSRTDPKMTASSETTWRRARCPVGDIGSTGLSGPWCRPRP